MLLGFSTGVFHKFMQPISKEAIKIVRDLGCNAIELSCSRLERISYLQTLKSEDLKGFEHVSLHMPNHIYADNSETKRILDIIEEANTRLNFKCVVMHPHRVKDWNVFDNYSFTLAIENHDNLALIGRNIDELIPYFTNPDYKMLLDLNHAYTNDPSLKLAKEFYRNFKDRICAIHLSGYIGPAEEDRHRPLFITQQTQIIDSIPDKNIPIIIESEFDNLNEARKEYEYISKYLV